MIVNILLVIMIVLRIIIATQMIGTAWRNRLHNLYWLALSFLAVGIGAAFGPSEGNPLGNLPVSKWLFTGSAVILASAFALGFNHNTFYKNRKSPLAWYMGLFVICAFIGIFGLWNSESSYALNPLVAFALIPVILIWAWHAWAAYQALGEISQDQEVEDWIKSRYRLMITYGIFLSIGGMASFVRTYFAGGSSLTPLGSATATITLVAQISAVILQFLTWVIPESFRRWLNRNHQARVDKQTRQEALVILDLIGSALSTNTGIPSMAALYSLRKIIGRQIKTEDAQKIEQRTIKMGYEDWMSVLNNPDLHMLIREYSVNANTNMAIEQAKQILIEKQSLFTMQAK